MSPLAPVAADLSPPETTTDLSAPSNSSTADSAPSNSTTADSAPSNSSTADDIRGLQRRRLLDQLLPLLAQGRTYAECAAVLAVSAPSLWRLKRDFDEHGAAGLRTRHANAGRPRLACDAVFGPAARAFVRRLTVQTESLPLALERLSDAGPCSPAGRALIDRYRQTGDYPPSFARYFRVTAEEWALTKGEKTFVGATHTARRGMFIIEEDGTRRELYAGDLVEADDVSVDVPYWFQLPTGEYRCGRQVLCFRDRRSRKWLGAYAVARERDSYRGEDIARACRELVDAWGLPGRFRFERGSWESAPISGIKVDDGRGGEVRWGGIRSVIPIQHVYTSNGKGTIEGGFRMLHKALGLHGVRIGKTRGEYEEPSAAMLAVNAGKQDPRAGGFIAWADLLGALEKAYTLLNGRPVHFTELNAKRCPDDVWTADLAARPGARLPACAPELRWHFLPVKAEIGAGLAQAGHAKVSVPGYPLPFFFRVGGMDTTTGEPLPFIERGHRLIVAFDPQRAAEGAVIFNAERGPKNTQGWRPLQQLFTAPLAGEAPQVDLSGRAGESPDLVARRVRNQQVRAAFTSGGTYGQGARRVRQDHDGQGNVARVETGAAARTGKAQPPNHKSQNPAGRMAPLVGGTPPSRARPPAQVEDFTRPAPAPALRSPQVEAWVEEW